MNRTGTIKRTAVRLCAVVLLAGLAACARIESEPPAATVHVVQAATATVDRFTDIKELAHFRKTLPEARAVVVFPALYKAGFIAGGEGGNGVLLARRKDGTWGYPAFYTLGAASVGLQAGIQATEAILIIRSEGALQAILKNQGTLGAEAGITVAVLGAGVEASTTTNAGADVVAYANSKAGLFGGMSLEGALLVRRTDFNQAFYGPGATPKGIILDDSFSNPVADPLRQALAKK